MEKIEKENLWGSILSVMQESSDMNLSSLRHVVTQIRDDMDGYVKSCVASGVSYEESPIYKRYVYLFEHLGGIYHCLLGIDGILTSLIVDMLSDD